MVENEMAVHYCKKIKKIEVNKTEVEQVLWDCLDDKFEKKIDFRKNFLYYRSLIEKVKKIDEESILYIQLQISKFLEFNHYFTCDFKFDKKIKLLLKKIPKKTLNLFFKSFEEFIVDWKYINIPNAKNGTLITYLDSRWNMEFKYEFNKMDVYKNSKINELLWKKRYSIYDIIDRKNNLNK